MNYLGQVPSSKSLFNRALIIRSFEPGIEIVGETDASDVAHLISGLTELKEQRTIDCGEGGTTFRFLALRASREKGVHRLTGSARLFSRPQDELIRILAQLGVEARFEGQALVIESEGWRPQGDILYVPSQRSSQFASSVLLNSWDLPFELFVSPTGAGISEGYWRMTQKIVESFGMKIDRWDHDFRVPAGQHPTKMAWAAEPDMSSAFSLAAVAAVGGSATLLDFPKESWQPDYEFLNILSKMGVPVAWSDGHLKIQKAHRLGGVAVKLSQCPDLFPVLASLCALAEGDSELFGAPQLIFKESNRIEKMRELLTSTGRTITVLPDGMKISGRLEWVKTPIVFDPDSDHRLAFAAAVLKTRGAPIEITDRSVVNKSFPGFWRAIGEAL